jgi:HSP20 family protein
MTANIIKRNGRSNTPAPASFTGLVDQIFQDNLNRFFHDDFWGFNGVTQQNNIPVNVRETDKTYEMDLVAPGLSKQDFKLNVANDMLTISFEHKEENNQEEDNWLRREYKMQSFTRSFNLDDTVDADKISAKYYDGILHLTLPKKENAQRISKTIQVA